MNIREAAALLDTTPKALRRVLRNQPEVGGVGLGGVYDVGHEQLEALRSIVRPAKEAPMPYPELDAHPGFDPALLGSMRKDPRLRRAVLARRAHREALLRARLADPEVQAVSRAARAEEMKKAQRSWAPVNCEPWRAGVDLVRG